MRRFAAVAFAFGVLAGWLLSASAGLHPPGPVRSVDLNPWMVFAHNLQVVVVLALGVATLGIVTMLVLAFNGAVLGAAAELLIASGHATQFWTAVAPHLMLEVGAFVVAGGADLRLAGALGAWLRAGTRPPAIWLARHWLAPHGLALALLSAAAQVEAYVSGF
jgi:uncharacterized membrane protein SpoIIM required for sporulation